MSQSTAAISASVDTIEAATAAIARRYADALTPLARPDEPDRYQPFFAVQEALRGRGGLARADDLARLLEDCRHVDFIGLAKLMVSGAIFSFEWGGTHWIPMFQFNLADLTVKPAARSVLTELNTTFDGWALAEWFTQPNDWLAGRLPVDMVDSDLPVVLDAARADRFIANG